METTVQRAFFASILIHATVCVYLLVSFTHQKQIVFEEEKVDSSTVTLSLSRELSPSPPKKSVSPTQKPLNEPSLRPLTKSVKTRTSSFKEAESKVVREAVSKPSSVSLDLTKRKSVPSELEEFFRAFLKEVDKRHYYPSVSRRLRQSGEVVIKFDVSSNGKLSNVKIFKKTPYVKLNQSAKNLIAGISKLKPLPEKYSKLTIQFPVDYVL